jgi:hypothetical protein
MPFAVLLYFSTCQDLHDATTDIWQNAPPHNHQPQGTAPVRCTLT